MKVLQTYTYIFVYLIQIVPIYNIYKNLKLQLKYNIIKTRKKVSNLYDRNE